ncbi:radial spoke head 1 homolog isoform X2 [Ceratina calcarata]|uniref:Radial spoke head 1 homolog isoform X2 n=1 Tax=Ceratina calcarata TaxID=156304 RepID=A0AAJ7S761_9HYME|nr:radial spoke head 1 homolog isoform X2 [Ceratina calcarata]
MYVGQYCKGLRHGRGLYVFKIGARYDGEWRQGVKYGQGTFWYPDGTRYEGEWKRDTKYGFGVYYYINGDVYEGSWRKNLRHGMGSYSYADTNTKFMGTWIKDRMQGPGQLIHPRHRFHGHWELNLEVPETEIAGRKGEGAEDELEDVDAVVAKSEEPQPVPFEPPPLRRGVIAFWRARCITPYNPDLLPPEPVPLQEEVSVDSLLDKCSEESLIVPEQYLRYEGEYEGEGAGYYDDNDYPMPSIGAI